jgi:hypothetical protein
MSRLGGEFLPEGVVVVRGNLIVVSDAVLKSLEGDEGLWVWDFIFLDVLGNRGSFWSLGGGHDSSGT